MAMKYITRGNQNPQGLQKVYFCCHPEEQETYLASVAQEILAKQNCAVFYYEPGEPVGDEDRALDLGQMQLFVMPVTAKLLMTKNTALDWDFQFAMERHIPVLPLMQENGLESLFNEKCGDLQFLNKYDNDLTALPYDRKLERFLSGVLIGDETAKKVRAAFDAYIFLSYRKKDRRYAQNLMRLIHQNEFCRDIAIWYDEFLVPGENFNQAIRDALEKSDFFTLVVTPNLVNEPNYVMTQEYPMAHETGMPILPTEMVKTDQEELKKKYAGIPDCTDAEDVDRLSELLLENLKKIGIQENNDDPEHLFFIGLAYLGGIDVETDYDKAVSMITVAAEAGVLEAMEKLVMMYRSGEGVTRNFDIAISWQEKLVKKRREIYEKTRDLKSAERYFGELRNLGDDHYEQRHLKDAEAAYQELLAAVRQLTEKKTRGRFEKKSLISRTVKRWEGGCLFRLGTIAEEAGDFAKAKQYYKSFQKAEMSLAWRPLTDTTVYWESETFETLSVISLGGIAEKEGSLTKAESYYKEALERLEWISEEDEKEVLSWRLVKSLCLERLALLAEQRGDTDEAWICYELSLEECAKLLEKEPAAPIFMNFIIGEWHLGSLAEAEGELSTAKEFFCEALNNCRNMEADIMTAEWRRTMTLIYDGLARLAEKENDLAKAREWTQNVLEIIANLDMESVESYMDLAVNYARMGAYADQEDDLDAAGRWYQKSLEVWEETVRKFQTRDAYHGLAKAAYIRGLVTEDIAYIKRAYGIWKDLAERYPEIPVYEEERDMIYQECRGILDD